MSDDEAAVALRRQLAHSKGGKLYEGGADLVAHCHLNDGTCLNGQPTRARPVVCRRPRVDAAVSDCRNSVQLQRDALTLKRTNQVVGGSARPQHVGARDHVGREPQIHIAGRGWGLLAGGCPVSGRRGSARELRASGVTEMDACLPLVVFLFAQRARRGPEGARELARPEPGLACRTEQIGDRGGLPELI